MKNWILNRKHIIIGVVAWWTFLLVISYTNFNPLEILNATAFLFLSLVPGTLTFLSLRLKPIPPFAKFALVVALSLLELMLVALLGNTLLPHLHVSRPLAPRVLIIEITALLTLLCTLVWYRLPTWEYRVSENLKKLFPSKLDLALSFLPIIFILQSIVGAFRLNNGANGWLTVAMVWELGIYSIILYYYAKKVNDTTVPVALFFSGVALLFMNSLRGWYISGHDIQTEYQVFEFTKRADLWNMDFYRDAYNACLSITILPTVFYNFLRVSDPFVYKFFFQFFFALCPGLTFLVSRHWAERRTALLAGFYFLAFPNFFSDMPFLVRQEIAFIYYGLMIYFIFEEKLSLFTRRAMFLVMGIGIILSHYSTTYTILLIFASVVASRTIILKLLRAINKKWGWFGSSSIVFYPDKRDTPKPSITILMVLFLFTASFLWTSIITKTGGHVLDVIKKTFVAVGEGLTENNRSTDATNLLSFRKPSQQQELMIYIKTVIEPIRKKAPAGVYFDDKLVNSFDYVALPDETMPLTFLGQYLEQKVDKNIADDIYLGSRLIAKLMEVLVPIGLIYLLFFRVNFKKLNLEYYLVAFFSLFFIFLNIVVPVLSTEYGIFRALQQSMFSLALPMVLGSQIMGRWFKKLFAYVKKLVVRIFTHKTTDHFATTPYVANIVVFPVALAFLFFLYGSSALPQIFGGNWAVLYFSNTGRYFDNYVIKSAEIAGVDWLSGVTKQDPNNVIGVKIQVQTDKYSQRKIASLSTIKSDFEIFPGAIRKDAYIFLGQQTTKKQRATLVFGGDQITYRYPVIFLDDNKNKLYNNGSASIYR